MHISPLTFPVIKVPGTELGFFTPGHCWINYPPWYGFRLLVPHFGRGNAGYCTTQIPWLLYKILNSNFSCFQRLVFYFLPRSDPCDCWIWKSFHFPDIISWTRLPSRKNKSTNQKFVPHQVTTEFVNNLLGSVKKMYTSQNYHLPLPARLRF